MSTCCSDVYCACCESLSMNISELGVHSFQSYACSSLSLPAWFLWHRSRKKLSQYTGGGHQEPTGNVKMFCSALSLHEGPHLLSLVAFPKQSGSEELSVIVITSQLFNFSQLVPWLNSYYRYFILNDNSGLLTIKEGTPPGTYNLRVRVIDGVWPDVVSTVKVTVKEIRDDALRNAGSVRIKGKEGDEVCQNRNTEIYLFNVTTVLFRILMPLNLGANGLIDKGLKMHLHLHGSLTCPSCT